MIFCVKNCKIKIKDEKYTEVNFSLKIKEYSIIKFNNKQIPLHLLKKITWYKWLTWSKASLNKNENNLRIRICFSLY